ncbi:MAG: hypothetical protein M1821_001733 [Bathelium mastoideum]|nr:MAG: hypothetical protein M1821_001733 [Bathelium mastoideum]
MATSSSSSADAAADIISYIGIPLAVLGVLPMLYTCIKCLLTLRKIRSTLAHAHLLSTATTRSSLLSGIIEIELPRVRLTPLDRADPAYGSLAPRWSRLRGGGWTRFRWQQMTVGLKTYRVQYTDEVRQPPAEIAFEALVAFLLDRGAVPYPAGWALLRGSGLWTPAGTKLLSSPKGAEAVLSVAASDDADGVLSLAVEWEPEWQRHRGSGLPPYWIVTEGPPRGGEDAISIEGEDAREQSVDEKAATEKHPFTETIAKASSSSPRPALHLHVTSSGLQAALYAASSPSTPLSKPHSTHNSPPITHLLAPHSSHPTSTSTWFATALTALHTLSPHPTLWSYPLPSALTTLAVRRTIPIGVLDLLGLLPVPSSAWRPTSHTMSTEMAEAVRQQREQEQLMARVTALRAEDAIKDPIARQHAVGERMIRDVREMEARRRRDELEKVRRAEEEESVAVRSERVEADVVAGLGVRWLGRAEDVCVEGLEVTGHAEKGGKQGEGVTKELLEQVVGRVLYLAVEGVEMATEVVKMLELWKEWGEVGGMTTQHLRMLKEKLRIFAYAATIVALVREAATLSAGSVVSDLQECLRAWNKVRLG